jgi:hypothetical protein
MKCANACAEKQYCFMVKPYYKCGHFMCFNSGMAIDWCIQCGCKSKNEMSYGQALAELFEDNEQQPTKKQSTSILNNPN